MAEQGAPPKVPELQRRALKAARFLFTPLLPDDYLELINPLWSTRELRGQIERVERETADAVTVLIRPGYQWPGHKPGQYTRVGVVVDGVFHWRAYSLTSEPGRPDGLISITPKLVDSGKVSPYLVKRARPGDIVRLGGVEGSFVMPDPAPEKALFLSAGSGITPIMSMLRDIDRRRAATDCVHVHSARTAEGVIFGEQLERLEARNDRYQVTLRLTGEERRIKPKELDDLCPDWREREAFLSGPGDLLDAMTEHWEREGDRDLIHMERFQPKLALHDEGEGGRINFAASGCETTAEGGKPILVAGEEAGLDLQFGCREGICHTCIGKLCSGQVRDLRNGKVYGQDGEMVRICISAPEGDVEIEL